MYEELLIGLRGHSKRGGCDDRCPCYDAKDRGYATCSEELAEKAAEAIEKLSRVADAIPHVCECCIGCEVESGGCDRAFVLSPKRAREYLNRLRWIPVTERLPENRDYYLAFTQANETYVCDFIPSVNQWWIDPCDKRLGNVTHWMPLPEPPKEET